MATGRVKGVSRNYGKRSTISRAICGCRLGTFCTRFGYKGIAYFIVAYYLSAATRTGTIAKIVGR